MNQLFTRLLQQAARKAPVGFGQAVQRATSVARDMTNPATYQQLAQRAERTLGGALPPQFSGANFGRIPQEALGLLNDVAAMPMGLSRIARSIPTSGAIREMAQGATRVPASIQQAASGALRAPAIGNAINTGRNIATGLTGGLVSPTGFGGPFARDPGLRREFLKQFGGTSQKAAEALARGGVKPSAVGGMFRNLDTAGRFMVGGSAVGAAAAETLGHLMFPPGSEYSATHGTLQDERIPAAYRGPAERFGPGIPSGLMDRSAAIPPGSAAPSAPVLPAPLSGGFTGSSFGGQQAGQQTPSAPVPPTGPGVVSNGAGVPAQRQNVQNRALSQEILNASQQYAAPAGVPISSFYAGQQQLGRSMEQTGELQRQLKELGGAPGMTDQALMSWAQANPGLAYRELQKLKSRSAQ
jgi:hypothetical protein